MLWAITHTSQIVYQSFPAKTVTQKNIFFFRDSLHRGMDWYFGPVSEVRDHSN